MVESSSEPPKTILLLYDGNGHILFVSGVQPPYSLESLIGIPAWTHLLPDDAVMFRAMILLVLESGQPHSCDVDVNHVGRWRTTLYPCHVGKVRLVGLARQLPAKVLELTDRQREICGLLAAGMSSKQIAAKLYLARETVDNHRSAICRKLGIKPWSLTAWCGEHREWLA